MSGLVFGGKVRNVIERKSNKCKIYNYSNSKKYFDEFSFTGLNNFDFFKNEFHLKGLE